jgi:hypothetical protein
VSEVDLFRKRVLGIVSCPSPHEIVYLNDSHRDIPIYQILDNTDHRASFDARSGDILVGGGSGESACLRLSMPMLLDWFTHEDSGDLDPAALGWIKAYWSFGDAYVFGAGYIKQGWQVNQDLPIWIAGHVFAFLLNHYPEYSSLAGSSRTLLESGHICRLPGEEDKKLWCEQL